MTNILICKILLYEADVLDVWKLANNIRILTSLISSNKLNLCSENGPQN